MSLNFKNAGPVWRYIAQRTQAHVAKHVARIRAAFEFQHMAARRTKAAALPPLVPPPPPPRRS